MIYILSFIFLVVGICSLLSDLWTKQLKYLYAFFGITLFLISGLRGENVDRDYGSYLSAFYGDNISTTIYEPTFILFSFLINKILYEKVIFLFVFYAFFGVILKLYAASRLTAFPMFTLLLYFSYFFILQDMTQIRIGSALTFFLFSIPFLYKRNWKFFILFILISGSFHFSAFVLFFLWFLKPNIIYKKSWFLFLISSILIGMFFKNHIANIFETIDFGPIQYKILAYGDNNNAELNIFNFWILLRIFISFIILFNIEKIYLHNRYTILLLKIYILSISLFYLLSFNPVFASRLNDILGIVEIILFPTLLYLFTPKIIPKIILLFYAFCFFFLNMFYIQIIK